LNKKAVIVISLVEQSAKKSNREIKKDILEELSKMPASIPWLRKVEKIIITKE
jgi:hypothetical protein